MGRAKIDNVRIAPDAILDVMKTEHFVAFGELELYFFHGRIVVLGIVECNVADLNNCKVN